MSAARVALSTIRKESVHPSGYCSKRHWPAEESILIYLSFSGSVIPIPVFESDSIASVKLRIQTCQGFVVKKQKLVSGGRELARNDWLVKDYGVTDGDVLHLVLRLSDLLLITVRKTCGEEFEFQVDRHRDVRYLKKKIAKSGKGFASVYEQEIFCNGEKLNDQRLIDGLCKDNDAAIHLLVQKSAEVRAKNVDKDLELSVTAVDSNEKRDDGVGNGAKSDDIQHRDFWLEPVMINPKVKHSIAMWDMINSTFGGLERGNQPIRSSEGTGGTYLMQDPSGLHYVAVFKPTDEEPLAINNPQELPISTDGQGLKKGTKVGEGALREVAAYVLDHPMGGARSFSCEATGFANVPPTTMVRCLHSSFNYPEGYNATMENAKMGSLQMYIENNGSCEDVGPGAFPVEQVHKICVFDIRMANADRHAGNILIGKGEGGQTLLIPIDHGYCLPESFEDCTFEWLYWPQAKQPFSAETISYINGLDSEQDIELLKFHGWDVPVECARTLHISTMLLKKGVERKLTPYEIGSIMCRETINEESAIEEMVKEAENSLLPGMSESAFLEAISQVMDSYLQNLSN